jgi:hypothetical protein
MVEEAGSIVAVEEAGSIVAKDQSGECVPHDNRSLAILPASLAGRTDHDAFVVVVRDAASFEHWLTSNDTALQWIEVQDLLGDVEVWRSAARLVSDVPIDVVMEDPAQDYAQLYRLVDARNARPIRVTIPVRPGFLKALRLAASLQLPVRLLPGQPAAAVQDELEEAVEFYLRDSMVEAPFEYFHSALVAMQTGSSESLWAALEEDPALYLRLDEKGIPEIQSRQPGEDPERYVRDYVDSVADTGECRDCRWLGFCGGYFKQPDPAYSCNGVIRIFDILQQASDELHADLAGRPPSESKLETEENSHA